MVFKIIFTIGDEKNTETIRRELRYIFNKPWQELSKTTKNKLGYDEFQIYIETSLDNIVTYTRQLDDYIRKAKLEDKIMDYNLYIV